MKFQLKVRFVCATLVFLGGLGVIFVGADFLNANSDSTGAEAILNFERTLGFGYILGGGTLAVIGILLYISCLNERFPNLKERLQKKWQVKKKWWKSLPKDQKEYLGLSWMHSTFGIILFFIGLSLIKNYTGLSLLSMILGAILLAFGILHYGFYLESRLRRVERFLEKEHLEEWSSFE